jgi:tetratricopeptide (TPR) repeat protein
MPPKPKTWTAIGNQRRKENFVGRSEQQRVFQENFTGDEPAWMVLSVTGEGGVGKSTLLKRYTQLAQAPEINANVVYCDDHQYTPVDAMVAVAEQLGKLGIESKNFNERHKKYRETLQQIESDPSAPRGMVNVVMRGLTDFTVKSLRRVPGVGVAADYIDEKAAGDALADLAQYTISRWGNKDEVQLVREPEKVLTPLFVELLNEATEDKRLVVMFDVFERTASTLSSWLIDLFGGKHGDISSYLSFTLSGRDPLEQHWTELAGLMTHLQLEPFTPEETAVYLSNQGITDETLVKQIHEDTGGLPVLVELLAATKPQPGIPLPDISKNAVERFLQWTPDENKRCTALLAAIPRQFDKDILSAMFGESGANLFEWLVDQSYTRSNAERGWYYHEKVRELMLRYQVHETHTHLPKSHKILTKYFAHLQIDLNLESKGAYDNQQWRRLELERIYHLFSAAPEENYSDLLNAFLIAFLFRWRLARRISKVAKQVLQESKIVSLKDKVEILGNLITEYEKSENQQVIRILNQLQESKNLDPLAKTAIFYRRGEINRRTGKYDEALMDLSQAIKLNDKYSSLFAARGAVYQQLGKHDEALRDLNTAIELDGKDIWAITSRGYLFSVIGNYEESLSDFDRALALDYRYVWAITQRAQTYRFMEKYDEALVELNRAISLDNKFAAAYAHRGATYYQMGKFDDAIQDNTTAIELDEKFSWAVSNRGRAYQKVNKLHEALADFTRAMELDKKNMWSITYRGITFHQMGRYDEAIKDFNKVIEGKPEFSWALINRGQTYRKVNKFDEALADFTRVIVLNDQNSRAFADRGETYRQLGRYEDALLDLNRAIEIGDDNFWARFSRAWIYTKLGDLDNALSDLEVYFKYWHPDIEDFTLRAITYKLKKDLVASTQDLNTALSMPCKKLKDHYDRATALILADRISEALSEFDIAFVDQQFRTRALLDNLLDPIRDLPEFKTLLAKYD